MVTIVSWQLTRVYSTNPGHVTLSALDRKLGSLRVDEDRNPWCVRGYGHDINCGLALVRMFSHGHELFVKLFGLELRWQSRRRKFRSFEVQLGSLAMYA